MPCILCHLGKIRQLIFYNSERANSPKPQVLQITTNDHDMFPISVQLNRPSDASIWQVYCRFSYFGFKIPLKMPLFANRKWETSHMFIDKNTFVCISMLKSHCLNLFKYRIIGNFKYSSCFNIVIFFWTPHLRLFFFGSMFSFCNHSLRFFIFRI